MKKKTLVNKLDSAVKELHAIADDLYWASIDVPFGFGYAASNILHGAAECVNRVTMSVTKKN